MLAESMDRMSRAHPYRKYRPNVIRKGNSKTWWNFAYTCILEEEVRRRRRNWRWAHMLHHRHMCKEYAVVYQEKLTCKKISKDLQQKLDRYEKALDLVNIVIVRQTIELEVERLEKKAEDLKKEQAGKGWFSGWWGSSATVSI